MKVYLVKEYWRGSDWDDTSDKVVCVVDSEEKAKAKVKELVDTFEERQGIKIHHETQIGNNIQIYYGDYEYFEYWYFEMEVE